MISLLLTTRTQRLVAQTVLGRNLHAGRKLNSQRVFSNTQRRPPVVKKRESTVVPPGQDVPKSFTAAMLPIAIIPVMFIMYGVSEHYSTNRQLRLNEELRQQFEAEHGNTGIQTEGSRPFLFYCVIRKTKGMTHSMSNIQVGDVVEVLEEGVGPNNEYNLCRFPAPQDQPHALDTVGWFPIRWLQKLEDYERIARNSENMVGKLKE
jgi:hypothetical protein